MSVVTTTALAIHLRAALRILPLARSARFATADASSDANLRSI